MNEKIIQISGRDVGFKAPASLPIRYRNSTGRDFFADMQSLADSTEEEKPKIGRKNTARLSQTWDTTILYNLAHAMAKAYDTSINPDVVEWVDSFDEFPIFEVFSNLQPLVVGSMRTAKK